jgi:hypothetical protein
VSEIEGEHGHSTCRVYTLSAGVRTDLRCVACFSAAVLRRSPYGRSAVYSLEATEVRSALDSLGCVVLWRGDVFGRFGGGGGWGRIENLECVYSGVRVRGARFTI